MALVLAPADALARNLQGAAWMALAMLGVAVNDALMKLVLPDIGMFQAILLRSVFAAAAVAVWLRMRGQLRPPARQDLPWLAIRSVAEIGATIFYLNAIMRLRLAEVSAINQSLPLLLTLAGVLFLGERVGWRRWLAILAGFAGVLLIVRPGGEAFDPDALYAVGGMICFGIREVVTRRTDPQTPSLLITFITLLTVGTTGAVGSLIEPWSPMEAWHLTALVASSVAIFVCYHAGVVAMRTGEIGFTAPFRYTVILWAIVLGFAVFGEVPDVQTLVGAAMIVAAGLYAFWRERRVGRAA
ncbi:DMT family transporter [Albimonas sp. CAU 1670]|uniref:DMT family transporter n=1 Tax=Albimonas sp. CAU 1670 TaxID=3032599 RepID=UPI0023DBCFA0|nr:DMT family transporter [Albimonas sp. CAU 1670]MDF2232513.1 DMT family transporter [Albimonas sp. CAU 1670]